MASGFRLQQVERRYELDGLLQELAWIPAQRGSPAHSGQLLYRFPFVWREHERAGDTAIVDWRGRGSQPTGHRLL